MYRQLRAERLLLQEPMSEESPNIRLLKAAFSKAEWDYLSAHGAFQYQLKNDDGTSKSYENLVSVGTLLLRQREGLGE
jgi:hypothetical protein